MPRLLLLIPTTSYRTADFMAAAGRLGVDVVVGSDQRQVLEDHANGRTVTIDLKDAELGAAQILDYVRARRRAIDAIVPVDDGATAVAARAAAALGLKHNPPEAIETARNKYRFRRALADAGLPSPAFHLLSVHDDAAKAAGTVSYPCVLKPLTLAASRGVIRADDESAFIAAFRRIATIIAEPDAATPGEAADHILVESYIPGTEVALEGLMDGGRLHVLALFDKPDALVGPYFEETIYVTPSRLDARKQREIGAAVEDAVAAVGLRDGPLHADIRINDEGVWMIEVDARSIGGQCARSLQFGAGIRLEEVILRHALGLGPVVPKRQGRAGGVMMIPIPSSGVLKAVHGLEEARAVPGIEEANITIPLGHRVVPLPDGGRYLGFLIGRERTPEAVVEALREAHRRITFDIAPGRR